MTRYLALLALLARLSIQQKDPSRDFCRRFGHQSGVVDQKLYIDGGLVNWNPIAQNPRNYTNTWLSWHDLTTSPIGIGVPQIYANLSKNASIPSVSGGSLWADDVNKRFYLYGGEYRDTTPASPELLSYDILYDKWDSFGSPDRSIRSVAWGGSVGISEIGKGYVLGGWMSNNTIPDWDGGPVATSYLLEYDYATGHWTNSTGPDNTPRAEGIMTYVPAGNGGLLVYFGGGTAPYNNDTLIESPMDTIHVYDRVGNQWYTEKATGDIPATRRRFCGGAAWATDRSSYNIYLYGGLGFGANYSGFDDVYILSLPTFTWIKYYDSDRNDGGKPHHSLSCDIVNGGQMLIIGGSFPLSDMCDSPPTWGVHNLDLGKQSGKKWVKHQLNITKYAVPPDVAAVIGGGPEGGATATAPPNGYRNRDLSLYFAQRAAIASRTPTRSIPTPSSSAPPVPITSKSLSKGAIAGVAVGGTLAFTILVLIAFVLIRRHRTKKLNKSAPPSTPPAYGSPEHMSQNNQFTPSSWENAHTINGSPQYQLPADSIAAELSATDTNNYRANSPTYQAKIDKYPQVTEQERDGVYSPGPPSPASPPPIGSPSGTVSPQLSTFSGAGAGSGGARGGSYSSAVLGREGSFGGVSSVGGISPQFETTPTYSQITLPPVQTGSGNGRRPELRNTTYYSP